MTNEELFVSLLGTPSAPEQAFMLEIPAGTSNPLKLLSRNLPKGGKVKLSGQKLFVRSEEFKHPDAVLLQV